MAPLLVSLNHSDRCCCVHCSGPALLDAKVDLAINVGSYSLFQHQYCIISIFIKSYGTNEEIPNNSFTLGEFCRWLLDDF